MFLKSSVVVTIIIRFWSRNTSCSVLYHLTYWWYLITSDISVFKSLFYEQKTRNPLRIIFVDLPNHNRNDIEIAFVYGIEKMRDKTQIRSWIKLTIHWQLRKTKLRIATVKQKILSKCISEPRTAQRNHMEYFLFLAGGQFLLHFCAKYKKKTISSFQFWEIIATSLNELSKKLSVSSKIKATILSYFVVNSWDSVVLWAFVFFVSLFQ